MKTHSSILLIILFCGIVTPFSVSCSDGNTPSYNLLSYIDTRVGTAASTTRTAGLFGKHTEEYGQTLPAVLEPNGMNFWTPQTQDGDLNTGADMFGWCQGYRSIKFFPDFYDYYTYSRNQDNDVPIFRYADIILTKCEAITRGATATEGDTPMSLFNQIRSYVNAPTITSNPSLQDILDERGREFLDEHWR